MILHSLYDYYQRKAADPESRIAPQGFEWRKIPFFIVINQDGDFKHIEPNEVEYLIPRMVSRSGGKFLPNLLWDNEDYVLGTFSSDKRRHEIFKKLIIEDLPKDVRDSSEINAVVNFYNKNQVDFIKRSSDWKLIEKAKNPYMTFKIIGSCPILCCAVVKDYVTSKEQNFNNISDEDNITSTEKGICLITGKKTIISRTHHKTFINKDANSLVSFQKKSGYDSYGKQQAYNASVGIEAEFAYTTALKMLLDSKENKVFLKGSKENGSIFLFWAEKQISFEKDFSFFINSNVVLDNPDREVRSMKSALESIFSGRLQDEGKTKFYILGLCQGGGSRIAIRLWQFGTVKDFAENIKTHFEELFIDTGICDKENYYSIYNILTNIALKKDIDNIPPSLIGNIVECMINKQILYPIALQQQCLRRIKADLSEKNNITHIRAAILKAFLNRKNRIYNINEKPITMALDLENTNQGYLCGRLFAVLEKIQEEAARPRKINAPIKERFYGAASSTPVTVFGRLLGLSNHHLAKLNPGRKTNFEKMVQDVMAGINSNGMPAHLSLDDQSRFAIGYYHQRQELFTKNETNN